MRFQVYEDAAGEWRWRLIAENGRIVADSGEGYAEWDNAVRAAESVRDSLRSKQVPVEVAGD